MKKFLVVVFCLVPIVEGNVSCDKLYMENAAREAETDELVTFVQAMKNQNVFLDQGVVSFGEKEYCENFDFLSSLVVLLIFFR